MWQSFKDYEIGYKKIYWLSIYLSVANDTHLPRYPFCFLHANPASFLEIQLKCASFRRHSQVIPSKSLFSLAELTHHMYLLLCLP